MVVAIASCCSAISRLDARISASSAVQIWRRRASWTGYARALQLQSVEIDEIDVFSWGCGLQIPGRARQTTTIDLFDHFEGWSAALADPDPHTWRDALPTAIERRATQGEHPALIRAFDQIRQYARIDASALPWLGLPFALRDAGLCITPLPCLSGGAKAFRLKRTPSQDDWSVAIRAVTRSAHEALRALLLCERLHHIEVHTLSNANRVGLLPDLLDHMRSEPVVSPRSVSEHFGITIAGASKLLARAKSLDLIDEITTRRSWRQFLSRDLALALGFTRVSRGRPRVLASPPPPATDLSTVLSRFDDEMAAIDLLLAQSDPGV